MKRRSIETWRAECSPRSRALTAKEEAVRAYYAAAMAIAKAKLALAEAQAEEASVNLELTP